MNIADIEAAADALSRTVPFDPDVVSGGDYLNDVRVDPEGGFAYVTDSASGGLVIVPLQSTAPQRRVLASHPLASSGGIATPIVRRVALEADAGRPGDVATDGIALSQDASRLFVAYRPLAGTRTIVTIPTASLQDETIADADLKKRVE